MPISSIISRGKQYCSLWVRSSQLRYCDTAHIGASNVTSGNDPCSLYHQDHRFLRCSRAMQQTFTHDKRLALRQIHDTVFKVNQEVPANDKEELIFCIVLVPMIFALHDAQPDDRLVDLA